MLYVDIRTTYNVLRHGPTDTRLSSGGAQKSMAKSSSNCEPSKVPSFTSLPHNAHIMASTTTPGIPPVTLDTITQQIGNTPLVRLNHLPRTLGIDATVYAKLEYFNAGGSVKDRIALRMIEEAERSGRIKPGDTLIEPTSGNTYGFSSSLWLRHGRGR